MATEIRLSRKKLSIVNKEHFPVKPENILFTVVYVIVLSRNMTRILVGWKTNVKLITI